MPHLSIRELVVEYSSGGYIVRPIDGLDLEADPGSLVLLLGPSGCGKTTLLSCLGGILSPTSGQILLGDMDVAALDGRALTEYRRHGVGIVFQAFNLVPSLTAEENVMAPMRAAKVDRSTARQRAAELLDRVGLSERVHHRPGDMSGGQQQRVAIARALALDPPFLLADEPTAHLDYVQVEEVLRLTRDLASGDRLVVVATHDHRMIPLADKVVELVPSFTTDGEAPRVTELAAGDVLFEEGSWGDRIYVIESGDMEIVRRREDGDEERLTVLRPGAFFGEMGPLFQLPRSATARAATAAVVTGYSVKDFKERIGAEHLAGLVSASSLASLDQP